MRDIHKAIKAFNSRKASSQQRKVKYVENQLSIPIVTSIPVPNQGNNGDLVIFSSPLKDESTLYYKSKGKWNTVQTSGFSNYNSNNTATVAMATSTVHDTGWFQVNNSDDTNNLSNGIYTISHGKNSSLVTTNVFCRFEALNNGMPQLYTIDLSSHVSNSGPNANRYGYWVNIVDNNTIEVHIHPDGLSILHSEILSDTNSNTSTLLSSLDSSNIGLLELRVVVNPITGDRNMPIASNKTDKNNPYKGNSKTSRVSSSNTVINTAGAKEHGTKESNFKIGIGSTGVLLKNNNGTLQVRNEDDDADAVIKAKRLSLPTNVSGVSGIDKGQVHFDSDDSAYKLHGQYLMLDNSTTGTDGEKAGILILPKYEDSFVKFFDQVSAKWTIGYDGYNTTTFTDATCVLTADSKTVSYTNGSALDSNGGNGLTVSGTGIPANTYINSINTSANTFTLTNAATSGDGSATTTLTFNTIENKFKINAGGTLDDDSSFELDNQGNLVLAGDIAVNGDTITSDGSLVIKATSVTLNPSNGRIGLKNNDTEYSVIGGGYAGTILGYQMIGEGAVHSSEILATSFAVTDADHRVKFVAPPSGNVEIFVQIFRNSSSSNRYLYLGLSDNATYNSIGASYEQQNSYADETDDTVINHTWVVTGLTPGTAYEYWLGAKTSSATLYLGWGGTGTGRYCDFIMKATALPPATAEFAVYD